MAKFACLFLVVFLAQNIWAAPSSAKISPALQASLAKAATAEIIVSFGGTGNVLAKLNTLSFATKHARAQSVVETLKSHAEPKQARAMSLLAGSPKVVSLWISNQVFVPEATADLIWALVELDEVTYIQENEYIPLDETEVLPGKSPKDSGILAEWGVENIRAHQVWAHANGNTGEGTIIATIDTGVRGTHESLRDNYGGQWLDPYDNRPDPHDANGHGTHTTGTIAGRGGIGVAPGSRWIACRGCSTSTCGNAQLISCGQWAVCPNSPSCSAMPDLVSNSWGGGRGNTFYDAVVQGWHSAGIIPLFSNGNSGPACNTANSPADSASGVLGIGSTTNTNAISSFSSKGPSIFGGIKPDISAPGSNINSAYNTGDSAYAVLSGTSMSCPHAAGTVALLRSRNPNVSYQQVKNLLESHASTNLVAGNQACGGIPDSQYPNHSFGHGKVDALASFNGLNNM